MGHRPDPLQRPHVVKIETLSGWLGLKTACPQYNEAERTKKYTAKGRATRQRDLSCGKQFYRRCCGCTRFVVLAFKCHPSVLSYLPYIRNLWYLTNWYNSSCKTYLVDNSQALFLFLKVFLLPKVARRRNSFYCKCFCALVLETCPWFCMVTNWKDELSYFVTSIV